MFLVYLNASLLFPVYVNQFSKAVGLAVFLLGFSFTLHIVSKHIKTGRATPVGVEKPIKFIYDGVYKYSRNPMYLAILLTFFGGFLFFGNFLLLIYVLFAIPAYIYLLFIRRK